MSFLVGLSFLWAVFLTLVTREVRKRRLEREIHEKDIEYYTDLIKKIISELNERKN